MRGEDFSNLPLSYINYSPNIFNKRVRLLSGLLS